ncbi:MAG TPA: hypothetical protein VLX09_10710 [Stellaceae bacterium]|nr:hypothetical protein [Stellaceae bacterium]
MRIAASVLAAGFALAWPFELRAADFDGSKPFLCATVDVASCVPGQDCARESPQSVNAPQFFTVDVGQKAVTETGGGDNPRTTKVERVDHQSGLMLLGGTDGGQAWSAAIGENNGKISYTVVGDRVVVVAFGACLVR